MVELLRNMPDHHLLALHRVVKTRARARAFFTHPRSIMILRNEIELRGLASWKLQ